MKPDWREATREVQVLSSVCCFATVPATVLLLALWRDNAFAANAPLWTAVAVFGRFYAFKKMDEQWLRVHVGMIVGSLVICIVPALVAVGMAVA